jgi:hypothetical protein
MFQYMLALVIQRRVPSARIVGNFLPEWGMVDPQPSGPLPNPAFRVNTHEFDLQALIARFKKRELNTIVLRTPSTRLDYYEARLGRFRKIFRMGRQATVNLSGALLIHVRLNKMSKFGRGGMEGVHRDYPVVPIAWYEELLRSTGLNPIFVGEFGSDPVSIALRSRFPDAVFVRNADPMEDFRLLYSAENLAISPSTFSWLAAWLSPFSQNVILPVMGIFNPQQRPDIDLLPLSDPRFSYYDFPVERWTASPEQVRGVISAPSLGVKVEPSDIGAKYYPLRPWPLS